MSAWWLSFSAIMILTPLACALAVRPSPDPDADVAAARRFTAWLVAGAVGALAIMLGLWRLWGVRAGLFGGWPLFFPLFFGLALPIMRARNPAWRGPHSVQPTVRTAALAGDRARVDPVPRRVWGTAWGLVALVLTAIAVRPLVHPLGEGSPSEWTRWAMALAVAVTTLPTLLIVTPIGIRASLREPEPIDVGRSPRLARAYAALRRSKAWFFAGLFLVMAMVVSAGVLVMAWSDAGQDGRALGLAGGIAGGVIGLAGAVGGIVMDRRRVRIHALLRELEREQRGVARATPGA